MQCRSLVIHDFNKLFNNYYQSFIGFALGYVENLAIAEDFVSEAFASYWEHAEKLGESTNAPAYILTIVKNKCLNYLKHQKVKQKAEKEITKHAYWVLNTKINTMEACNPEHIFSKEMQQIIEETLDKLPTKTKNIFLLSRYKGLSHKDIAAKINISTKTVEFHITKALSHLRLSLKSVGYIFILIFLSIF